VSSILENSEELQQALKENIFRNGSFVTKELNVTFKNRLYLLLRLSDSFEEKQKKQLFEKSYYLGVFLTVVSLLISISTYFVSRNFKRTNLLANIDKLTGLYNRRMIDTKFDDAFNSCLKLGSSLSCMIIDIDHFKKINDNYGHQVGDSTLVELSKILMSETRKIDIVGRWGGEEFIIIASRTDIELAKKLSERVRVAVENHTFKDVGNITVSIGVSSVDFSSKEDETIDKVVERADNALYVAKENGRNRVEVKI